jgi:hypothetical protein
VYLELLVIAVLAAHLLAVNIASGGPLIAAWLWRHDGVTVEPLRWMSVKMTKASLGALMAGSLLGAALLAVPSPGLTAALARFPMSTYWYAGLELVFSGICLTLMLVLQRANRIGRWGAWLLAALSASNLLYHFPPLMAVFGELVADPTWTSNDVIDRPAMLRLWMRPAILAMWMHFTFAAIATSAIFALWMLSHRQGTSSVPSSAEARRSTRRMAAAALIASLLQVPVGVWLLVASDETTRDALIGGSLLASALFLGGLLTTIALLQSLMNLALGDQTPAAMRRAAWLLIATVVLMTGTLRLSRASDRHDAHGDAAKEFAGQGRGAVI